MTIEDLEAVASGTEGIECRVPGRDILGQLQGQHKCAWSVCRELAVVGVTGTGGVWC
jgi:hypothetical protein